MSPADLALRRRLFSAGHPGLEAAFDALTDILTVNAAPLHDEPGVAIRLGLSPGRWRVMREKLIAARLIRVLEGPPILSRRTGQPRLAPAAGMIRLGEQGERLIGVEAPAGDGVEDPTRVRPNSSERGSLGSDQHDN